MAQGRTRNGGLTSVVQTRNDDTTPAACREEEACFKDCEDGKTTRTLKNGARNDLVVQGYFSQGVVVLIIQYERRRVHCSRCRRSC
jgi:hypothetical protein